MSDEQHGQNAFKQPHATPHDLPVGQSAEQRLREAEERYRALFERSLDAVYLHDLDGRFLDANPAALQLLGYAREEIPGLNFASLLTCEHDLARAYQSMQELMATGFEKEPKEFLLRRKDGAQVWVEVLGSLVFREGRPVAIQGIARDITERKRTAGQLLEAKELLDSILVNLPVGVFVKEVRERTIILCNRVAEDLFGRPACEILGRTADELFPSEQAEFIRRTDTEVLATKKPLDVPEIVLDNPRLGQRRWHVVKLPIIGGSGEPEHLLYISEDITERRRGELEREKLHEQFMQSQKMESVGRLAGGVAHDFNNMLGVIIGHAEMALDQLEPGSPVHDSLLEIQKAAQRSADLTRQLLAFARKQTIRPRVLDLNETVGSMLKMLKRLIGEDIELRWNPGANLWSVNMDPAQVDQILANLAVNARDAISGVGRLGIATENVTFDQADEAAQAELVPGDYVLLTLSDTGSGMDPATMEHLFEPFFTTKEVGKGTGLGLATVYGTVRQNGGFITVESEPGRGSTFRIFLPRGAAPASGVAASPETAPVRGTETVLLVEDEAAILRLGTNILKKQGYTVLAAQTPAEALQLARDYEAPIHLLITDVVMPEMNGKELKDRLLALHPDMRVMFMSGYTADVIAHQGILEEGVTFLQKPFSVNTLAQKVREVIQ